MINTEFYSNKGIAALIDGYAGDSIDVKVVFWVLWQHPNTADFYTAYHDRVVDLSGAFFHFGACFVRPLLNAKGTFALFVNLDGKQVTTHKRSYATAVLGLGKTQRLLDKSEYAYIDPVLEDLRRFCLHPSFARGIKIKSVHSLITDAFSYHRLALMTAPKKRAHQAMQLVALLDFDRILLFAIIHLFNLFSDCIQIEQDLSAIELKETSYAVFIQKLKKLTTSVEGQAFSYRWIRFQPQDPASPVQTTLVQTQLADFKKKYLSHNHLEIRFIARQCLKLFELQHLYERLTQHLEDIQRDITGLRVPENAKGLQRLVERMHLTPFPAFLKFLDTYQESRWQGDEAFTVTNLKSKVVDIQIFMPSIHLLYDVFSKLSKELTKLQNKKNSTKDRLSSLGDSMSHVGTRDTSLIEELDLIDDPEVPPSSASSSYGSESFPSYGSESFPSYGSGSFPPYGSEGAPAIAAPATTGDFKAEKRPEKEAPHATATGIPEEGFTTVVAKKAPDPLKYISLKRDFPLKPLKYDDRVRAHFKQLTVSGKSYSAASRDIQVHAYSPLVDRYVGTVYSLPSTWTNTQTKTVDKRYLLPAQLTLPGQRTRDVVFRYTQGADEIWYHRDLTYRDETQLWHQVDFPKPQAAPKNKETWTVESAKGTESYDPHTETILLELEDGTTIRLFRVR